MGVPLNTPDVLRLRPLGSNPVATEKLYGVCPPDAPKFWLKATPAKAVLVPGLLTLTVAVKLWMVRVVVLRQPDAFRPVRVNVPGWLMVAEAPAEATKPVPAKVYDVPPAAVSDRLVWAQVRVFERAPTLLRAVSVRLGKANTVALAVAVLVQPTALLTRTLKL